MSDGDLDGLVRMAAFEHVRTLGAVHDHLTTTELAPGFNFRGERIPLINPQRGIFKPQQMRFLLHQDRISEGWPEGMVRRSA